MVDFSHGRGSEQRGRRPALVVQNDVGNAHASTTIVAAVTTIIKQYPVTVVLDRSEGGLKKRSMVNLTQILTVDRSRLKRRLGALREQSMEAVDRAVRISLDVL